MLQNYFYVRTTADMCKLNASTIPDPMPPTTLLSGAVRVATLTTDGPAGLCGAMLGRYKQPNPSELMSSSTAGGGAEGLG